MESVSLLDCLPLSPAGLALDPDKEQQGGNEERTLTHLQVGCALDGGYQLCNKPEPRCDYYVQRTGWGFASLGKSSLYSFRL